MPVMTPPRTYVLSGEKPAPTGPFVSIWTDADTSEAGPTVDEKAATVSVGAVYDGNRVLHIVTDDGSVGLWTVAVTLDAAAVARLVLDLTEEPDDGPLPCPTCGSTETTELHDSREGGPEQSITICAGCGSDE
jgi:hypothetical protein